MVAIARVKYSISKQHLRAARHFSSQATRLEADGSPIPEDRHSEHRAYVTAAVLLSVAALEASINELYHEVISGERNTIQHFDKRAIHLMTTLWEEDTERRPILEKYQRALLFADLPIFKTGANPFQVTDSLIRLRDNLVHYQPEWHDEKGRHQNLEQRLRGKFALNPGPTGQLWFPQQCLSAGCATWATKVVAGFMMEFCDRLGIPQRFPPL